jgi:RecB family exonuclease
VLRNADVPSVLPAAGGGEGDASLPPIRIAPLHSLGKGEIFSATSIKTYRECPALYYIKYVLGLSAGLDAVGGAESEETSDAEYPGELRGRVFHGVMQRIDTIGPRREIIDAAARRLLASEGVIEGPEADRLVAEVLSGVQSVLASDLWLEAGAGAEVRTEFTISSVLGDDYLSGTIDRLYRDASGFWNVLDYKTDRVEGEGLLRRAATYWPQLEFYALLVQRYFDVPHVQSTLLFTSAPGMPLRQIFTADQLSRFEQDLRLTIGRIKSGDFRPAERECPGCPMKPGGCRQFFPASSRVVTR